MPTFTFTAPLDFPRTLAYIGRYEVAQREAIREGVVYTVLSDDSGFFLIGIQAHGPHALSAEQLTGRKSKHRDELLGRFVARSFGSDEQLTAFYRFAKRDELLARLVKRFRGVRLVGMVSLWECLFWSIIGQQVSVQSAFSVRARLAQAVQAVVKWNGTILEGFPRPADIVKMSLAELNGCGLTRQKSEYVRDIALAIQSGKLNEADLTALPLDEFRARLLALRGIGPWSVEYAMMRVGGDPDACPVEDIGLRNALGKELGLGRQATIDETRAATEKWHPFRAYATFYLWQTLW